MPNWVYNNIEVEQEYTEKLEQIAKKGICQYFKPQPEAYGDTKSPTPSKEENPYEYELSQLLLKHHGFENWHDWRTKHWGVKWDASQHWRDGKYQNYIEGNYYRFETPWGRPDMSIFELLAKEIPNFSYWWEEEQGFGEEWECVDGELRLISEWDMPIWKDNLDSARPYESCGTLSYLLEDFTKLDETYSKGYYLEYDLQSPLGLSYKRAMKEYNKLTL
jgi:hypothetical protein